MVLPKEGKILVTGGAGFVGSHLCEKLIELGYSVVCMDNYFTGRKSNVERLLTHSRFTLLEHDVCNSYDLEVDGIFNLACPASPKHYQMDPIFTMKTSFFGALHALELAKDRNIPVLQASTSEIYGDPIVHPQIESYWGNVNPIGVRSCYDEGKRCAETLFFDYHRTFNVPIKIARIFNTYGPRMLPDDGRVVSNFIIQSLSQKPITIYGSGNQTRSFCYVDDLVEGLISLMQSPKDCLGPINLGNPKEFLISELASLILEKTGSSSNLIFEELPPDDPKQRKPDILKAQTLLNWNPKVSITQGLDKTIQFFRHVYFHEN
ncbi:MAG: SDR family oxidoreductase [Chlamydiae bacterium]|nr:SDR family oxidoreductase [Chlamydiota bacterium]